MNKLEEIINASKKALEQLNLKGNFNEENSVFLLKLSLENISYKVKIHCTDQYLAVMTRLPLKPSENNFSAELAKINENIAVGYYHQDQEGFITSRVNVGLKDSTATASLVQECILRGVALAQKRLQELSSLLNIKIITNE